MNTFLRSPTDKISALAWLKYFKLMLVALFMLTGALPALAADPDKVSTTLEGCKADGTFTLPIDGKFICADSFYTTGNLGKTWNELDLVPYRITFGTGNAAPTSQTYTIAVVLDNLDAGAPGYDVLSEPVLNTAKSSASCTAAIVGPQSVVTGFGGIDQSIYRLLTITQAKNTTCVYDYYGRLALGSHLFPGSSLHANNASENLSTQGIGASDVSIPVKEISPQGLRKDMAARQDANHTWNLTKAANPASISFGDVCAPDAPASQPVTFRVEWTKIAATPGTITATTNIYAKNPAARTITVNVTDVIYQGTTQTNALDSKTSGPVNVPANTELLVLTHTATIASSAGTVGSFLNDVATATYTDLVTGIPVPGQTTAVASAEIKAGNITNTSASIADVESISGAGLTFSVAAPSVGAFDGYTAGDVTVGPVTWKLAGTATSGSVDFNKTIYLAAKQITSGTLTDTAALAGSDGFTKTAGPINVGITSSASVKLTIEKKIPAFLDTGEKLEVTFHVSRLGDATYSRDVTLTFTGGGAATLSETLSGLVPDDYTVVETSAKFFAAGSSTGVTIPGFQPEGGSTKVVQLGVVGGKVPNCAGSASFNNVLTTGFATAQVQKITDPALTSADADYSWTFTLNGPGLPAGGISATAGAGAGYVSFISGLDPVQLTSEGTYTVTETTKSGWDLNSATPNNGTVTTVCSFTVNYPQDVGSTKQCTFKNTKRGKAQVVKTVSGGALSGTQSFTFQLRQGASTTANGTTLESQVVNAATPLGTLTFSTKLVPGATYQLCESVMPGWQTSLGTFVPNSFNPPDGVATNPNVDNSILCGNFTVAAGETKVFTVDNTPPPGGRALTIGFWKNWASCKQSGGGQKPVLDQTMAKAEPTGIQIGSFYLHGSTTTPNVAPDCSKAVNLLDKSTFGGVKKASDPLFNMAAQLVAAELNYAAGAGKCGAVTTAIIQANALLSKYNFTGNGYTGKLSAADATLANSLAKKLDDYNNNRASACL